MEIIVKLATYLQGLSKKQFQKILLIAIGLAFLIVVGVNYYIYQKSLEYVMQIKQFETLANKSVGILEDNQKMEDEALRIQGILDQNKEFNIKSYFEGFCQQNSLVPTQGFDTRLDDSNDKFDEIYLSASFKSLTMDKIVKILEEFYKKEIIYIKSMSIKQEQEKKVSFEITIATKSMKKGS
jgi:hypothetical protein